MKAIRVMRGYRMSAEETVDWLLREAQPLGECLLFMRNWNSNGYPKVSVGGKHMLAGRLVLTEYAGESQGRHMLHSCHNKACVNPAHLRWGTPRENSADSARAGLHPIQKLTPNDVFAIKAMRQAGVRCGEVARCFGVKSHTISGITAGARWAHLGASS